MSKLNLSLKLSAMAGLVAMAGCDGLIVEKENQAAQTEYQVQGDESQKQGFYLALPDLPDVEYRSIKVEIYRGSVAFAEPAPYCDYPQPTPEPPIWNEPLPNPGPPPSEGPISSPAPEPTEALSLADVSSDVATDENEGDSGGMSDDGYPGYGSAGVYMSFEIKAGANIQEIRLPSGPYTLAMTVYDDNRNATHNGIEYFQVASQTFSEISIVLRKIKKPDCEGVVKIDYVIEGDDGNSDAKVDVCQLLEQMPIPSCTPEPTRESCYLPGHRNVPDFKGRTTCGGTGKYVLLKEVCNALQVVYQKQIDGIMCENSLIGPTENPN